MIVEEMTSGRIALKLLLLRCGNDLCALIGGGSEPHIGAIALAEPYKDADGVQTACTSSVTAFRHRDDELARYAARELVRRFGNRTAVICGVHLDHIAGDEIKLIFQMTQQLIEKCQQRIHEL